MLNCFKDRHSAIFYLIFLLSDDFNINHYYNFHSFVELKCVISFCLNFIALKYYLLSCSRLLTCLYFLRLIRYYRKFIDNELLILALPHKIYH